VDGRNDVMLPHALPMELARGTGSFYFKVKKRVGFFEKVEKTVG
jgi:hypothetical protein